MITTVLCYSATSGSDVADYGKPCRVDMGNVGYNSRMGMNLDLAPAETMVTSVGRVDNMPLFYS